MATAIPAAIAKQAASAYSPEAGKKSGQEIESVETVIDVLTTGKNVAESLQRVRAVSIARESAGGERGFNYLLERVYQAGFSFTDMSRLPGASRQ